MNNRFIGIAVSACVLAVGTWFAASRKSSSQIQQPEARTAETALPQTSAPALSSAAPPPTSTSQSAVPAQSQAMAPATIHPTSFGETMRVEAWQESISQLANRKVSLPDSGLNRAFELAMDEVFLKGLEGGGAVRSIREMNGGLLQGIQNAGLDLSATQPVLYEVGFPRSESSRRIVTKQVLVMAPDKEKAEKLADQHGLAFKDAPAYAPGKFIFEAESAWDVLEIFAVNRDLASSEIQPLLAANLSPDSAPNDPLFPNHWHLAFLNQAGAVAAASANVSSVWGYGTGGGIRGQGIVVGIVDDGLDPYHPDLKDNMNQLLGWDWVNGDNNPEPGAGDSHGTAVAGNVAARGNNAIGAIGAAPEATLVGMRLLGGPMTDADIADSIARHNNIIHIKNNSWGDGGSGMTLFAPGPLSSAALQNAATAGRNGRGSIIVRSGGNGKQSKDNSNYFGFSNSIYAIAVAAMDSRSRQSAYSEPGANLAICAPSNGDSTVLGISTTDLQGSKGYNSGGSIYDYQSFPDYTRQFGGTSSAAPTVSGIIALMLQANPMLGYRDVKEILMETAVKVQPLDNDWATNGAGFHFNHKFGAGRVDAAAAVSKSSSWKNLPALISQNVTDSTVVPIPDNSPLGITRNLTISASPDIRVEHVTLGVKIPQIPKGQLLIELTSPSGTKSVLCEPHWDSNNELSDWVFMTVRCWGEAASGNWTVKIADLEPGAPPRFTPSGNLEGLALTVHGSSMAAHNPPPVVEIVSPKQGAALRSPVTFTANASDFTTNGTVGTVSKVDFLINGIVVHTATQSPYSFTWNASSRRPGDYTVEAQAQDSSGLVAASLPITFQLLPNTLVAGWDFETLSANQSAIALLNALQSARQYAANFGSNNATVAKMLVDGTFGSSRWETANGEIWSGTGSAINAGESFSNSVTTSSGLMLRAGKNRSANEKSVVFQINMAGARRLNVSYATFSSTNGFTTQKWEYSKNGTTWLPLETFNPTPGQYEKIILEEIGLLNNSSPAFLRLTVSGASGDSGHNLFDNIVFSATR